MAAICAKQRTTDAARGPTVGDSSESPKNGEKLFSCRVALIICTATCGTGNALDFATPLPSLFRHDSRFFCTAVVVIMFDGILERSLNANSPSH